MSFPFAKLLPITLALLSLAAHDLHYSQQEIDDAVNQKTILYGTLLKLRNLQTNQL